MNVNWLMQSEKNLVPPITNNAVSQQHIPLVLRTAEATSKV